MTRDHDNTVLLLDVPELIKFLRQMAPGASWVALQSWDNIEPGTTCSAPTLAGLIEHLSGGVELPRVVAIIRVREL